jgi:hypothetical protein
MQKYMTHCHIEKSLYPSAPPCIPGATVHGIMLKSAVTLFQMVCDDGVAASSR